MHVFSELLTSRGGRLSFSRASSDCLCTAPCTHVVMVIRGLTFYPTVFSVWMRGYICLFLLL